MTTAGEVSRLTRRAAILSVSVASTLALLKVFAAIATGSVAVLGSLADSALDIAASLVTLFGVHIAAQPADEDHRFGHGKAEAMAALFQVVVIAVSASLILIQAARRFLTGGETSSPEYGIIVSAIAMVATLGLVAYQRRIVARTGSVAIRSDSIHYSSDLLLNAAVMVALLLDGVLGVRGADPFFGIAIALWLMLGAWRAAQEAINQLMDREWPDEKRRRVVEVASAHPQFRGIHDLRTRTSGMHDFVQFHLEVDPDLSVRTAHDVVEDVERALERAFPGADVLIHLDPEGHVDQPGNTLVEERERH